MHTVAARLTLLGVVLAGGAAAAYFLLAIDRQDRELASVQQDAAARLDRLSDAVIGIGAAQRAFVAPGNLDERSLERVTSLVTQINDDAAYLKSRLRSADAAKSLQSLTTAVTDLIAVNARARDNLGLGQDVMAADIIAGGRSTVDVISGAIRDLRAAERAVSQADAIRLARQRWTVLAPGSRLVDRRPSAPDSGSSFVIDGSRSLAPVADPRPEEAKRTRASQPRPSPTDLTAAAALCTALSRITTTAALTPLLAQAADLLDAPGIILWMGAGDQLFAVTAHGYRPETHRPPWANLQGRGQRHRAAWRTGHITTVAGHCDR